MTTFHTMDLICPNCNESVVADVLTSTNFVGQHTDLHRITAGSNPLEFMVHTCPSCGFTAHEQDYHGKVDSDISNKIKERIFPIVKDSYVSTDSSWEFAAIIAEWRGTNPEHLGSLYLNAAWTANNVEKEHYYRRKAADCFEQYLETEDRTIYVYLVGELYRRVGDINAATYWFDLAISECSGDPELEDLKKLVIQQKIDPQDVIGE